MKKLGKKQIEAIAQELLNVPTDESIERMELVKERAFQEYERRQRMKAEAGQLVTSSRGSKVKGLGYRMMTAVAIALAILIIPVVFPAPISVADDDWGRSIAIWLNDTLHTQIRIPDSIHAKGGLSDMEPGDKQVFSSIEELLTFLNSSLLVLGNEDYPCELQSITVTSLGDDVYRITEEYMMGSIALSVSLKTALSSQTEAPLSDTMIIYSDACEFLAWANGNESRAFGQIDEWLVLLSAKCDLHDAAYIFATAHVVN